MASFLKSRGRIRLPLVLALAVIILGGGLAAGKWIVWPKVKTWREQRTNNVAREKLQQGDLGAAMTAVKTSLRYNQNNLSTWKLGAEIAEKQKSPEQFTFFHRVATIEPTLENRVKFIRLAADNGYFPQALEMVAQVKEEGARSAEFLELAALVNQRMGKNAAAKGYLQSLITLKPNDNNARFELARLRLIDGFSENQPAARNEVKELARDPSLREKATALLLADAITQKKDKEALEYADQLAAGPISQVQNQILVAEAYRRFAPVKHLAFIAQIEKSLSDSGDKAIAFTSYLINSQQIDEAIRWTDTLPEKTKAIEGLQINYAFALLLKKDWTALETYLRSCKWKENEFARYAMLAYKHRAVGNERAFAEAWKLAVIEVGNNNRKLQALLARVNTWNWTEERFELLWKRFSIDPGDMTNRQQLIAWESSKGNTSGLSRIFARVLEISPQDANARNNFAYTSLLLGTNIDQAAEYARQNLKEEPKNIFYITTQSLALYKQGKPQEALQMLDSVGAVGVSQPDRMLLRALYLAELGRAPEAADVLANVRVASLALPEERRLHQQALTLIARAEREQGNVARLASLTAQQGNADRKSWVAILPESLRKSVNVPMELADTFYAVDDYRGLENALKSDRWDQNEFLRFALLAYAQRGQSHDSDARTSWRTAVAGAGNNSTYISTLVEMCERWGWQQEQIELVGRIYARDPLNEKAFRELIEYYTKAGQTAELARIYEQRCDANRSDSDSKARFAYYSLLTNTNVSRAHVSAREAYDANSQDAFRSKVYAFSLLKQSRPGDAWRILENMADNHETGQAQTGLLKATVAMQRKDSQIAKAELSRFDAGSALPEETALADSLNQALSKSEN
ncbi:MAG: hypothetical protein QM790_11020 [Nibricoccus sp.]